MEIEKPENKYGAGGAPFTNPPYLESFLIKSITTLFITKFKPYQDPRLLDIINRLKRVMHYKLSLKEDKDIFWDTEQKEIKCNFCKRPAKSHFELIIHWLYSHREYNFRIKFHKVVNASYILSVECHRKLMDKKDTGTGIIQEMYILSKKKDKLFERFKNRFGKVFVDADIGINKKKPKVQSKKMLEDLDSDEPDEEKHPNDGYSQQKIKEMLKDRVFFHTKHMFRKVSEDSLFVESEDEIDDRDVRRAEEEAIDAFEDVDPSDKQFFKLWNNFIRDQIIEYERKHLVAFTTKSYPKILADFIKLNKAIMKKDELRNSFVMHLCTLNIYDLITKDDILNALLLYEND